MPAAVVHQCYKKTLYRDLFILWYRVLWNCSLIVSPCLRFYGLTVIGRPLWQWACLALCTNIALWSIWFEPKSYFALRNPKPEASPAVFYAADSLNPDLVFLFVCVWLHFIPLFSLFLLPFSSLHFFSLSLFISISTFFCVRPFVRPSAERSVGWSVVVSIFPKRAGREV